MGESERNAGSEAIVPEKLGGHDEPIVIENGPATVLFGKRHKVESKDGGKTWMREHVGNFIVLYIQEETANGDIVHVESFRLAQITMIRVRLESGEAFDFTRVKNGAVHDLQMISAVTKLDRDGLTGSGRLMFKGGKRVSVTRVEGYKDTTLAIDYTPETSSPRRVKVVILPEPEKP